MTPQIWGKRKHDYNVYKACHPTNDLRHQVYYSPHNRRSTNRLTCPFSKSLTAALPVFDGKSGKFELFEDSFRKNVKKYPHLTEIQKINYFHSLLRGNALQAYCNLDDAKIDNLEEVITAFKRPFGDFPSSAKARCERDSLHFDPTEQKLHECLDTLQNQLRKCSDQRRKISWIRLIRKNAGLCQKDT